MKLYAVCLVVTLSCFRPLIRGFFFYCHCILLVRLGKRLRFRPLIRGFFFYELHACRVCVHVFYKVSVPSFGDSFFMRLSGVYVPFPLLIRFRPLIRGFFFYDGISQADYAELCSRVSVPSFGDSFFIKLIYALTKLPIMVSVPSFGDSFLSSSVNANAVTTSSVSVPSFGDSFFIWR